MATHANAHANTHANSGTEHGDEHARVQTPERTPPRGVAPRAAPTTAYLQVCTNCGYATFIPNPNITAAKALGRSTMFPPTLYAGSSCPHCNNGAMVNTTLTLP